MSIDMGNSIVQWVQSIKRRKLRPALLDDPDHFCKQIRFLYKTVLWAKNLSFLHYKAVAVIILKSFIVEERCVITDSHCRPTAPLPSGTIKQTQKNKNRLLQGIQMQNTNTEHKYHSEVPAGQSSRLLEKQKQTAARSYKDTNTILKKTF